MENPKVSSKLMCAKQMPELKHRVGDGEFDITKSEVCKWLMSQPDIIDYIFDKIRGNKYREPLIVYDPERGTYRGAEFKI
ncbi:hypothetical protein DEAC_c17240 [Desulfosporosinus acididurans]|uniref:Uncharacterized protein n=1 Tax=Desulfosporosinus acididurans TaxID=476652 RepID=A0A0J1FS52_9FIRM|nr:hypothetical protein [Desulfosporosinus acididurans]KLU66325.1 hypothetical protein DEAC_c17240 [Desulfosporosinus acididurans]